MWRQLGIYEGWSQNPNFEMIAKTGSINYRSVVRANGKAIMLRKTTSGVSPKHEYIHRDHLGSVTALTRETDGTIIERYSYDAWGKRRSAANWTTPVTSVYEHRGYTGHEHLDDIGIIHMNGRVYDPKLGRMLSPDPVTQAPENGQNYNRYSYANNNPLKYTDPSGYEFGDGQSSGGTEQGSSAGDIIYAIAAMFDSVGGLFRYDSCDRTCKLRNTAFRWCQSSNACSDLLSVSGTNRPRVLAASLFQTAVTTTIGDNARGGTPVSDQDVVGVTDRNFQGFKEDDIFLNEKDAQKVFKFFFTSSEKMNKDNMTLDDRAFAQFLLLNGIEWTATGIGGILEIGEKLSGKAFDGMGKKAAARVGVRSVMEATVRKIQDGRVAHVVRNAFGLFYRQEYLNRLNPNIGSGKTFIVSD